MLARIAGRIIETGGHQFVDRSTHDPQSRVPWLAFCGWFHARGKNCNARWLPKTGAVWTEAERKLWLDLLSGSFKLIYKDNDKQEANLRSSSEKDEAAN
jgi:hypothetical protein